MTIGSSRSTSCQSGNFRRDNAPFSYNFSPQATNNISDLKQKAIVAYSKRMLRWTTCLRKKSITLKPHVIIMGLKVNSKSKFGKRYEEHEVANIPEGTTKIEDYAFRNRTELKCVVIPDSVTEIGYRAFEGCTNLTSIDIPDSVTKIRKDAFEGCTGLKSIFIPNSVTEIESYAFNGCTGLTSIKVSESNKTFDSRDNCNAIIETANNKLISGCAKTVIPDSVTKIGDSAFFVCKGLTSIVIPDSVTEIGDYAFYSCTGLTDIVIPDSVTEIRNSAFKGCTGLTSIVIPDSVTKIGYSAFSGCTGLTSIVIPDSVTKIGYSAFSGCTGLTSIIIPDSVTEIGGCAFEGCDNLESIYCHVEDPTQINIERGAELGGHQATLYVPAGKGVVAAYKKKAVWKKFAAIKPMKEY